MKKQSIKRITIAHLSQVFILSILVILSVMVVSYNSFFEFVVENKVKSVSEIIKAGLTSHMKAGIMDKRDYFLNEISSVYDIESIKIIRSDDVIKQYGEAKSFEKKLDDDLRAVLSKKEIHIEWDDKKNKVEAIVPYIANSSGSFNCLECHNVKDQTVLGAVNISMDVSLYDKFMLKNGYIMAGVLLFSALITVLHMFRVVERYIYKPLLKIIDDGKSAYLQHKKIDSSEYESRELEDVVHNVNNFNQTVIEKEEELKDKNLELKLLNEEIEATLKETMFAVGEIEEIRGDNIKLHTKRVAVISTIIAKEYGLSKEQIKLIEIAAPLHDIGKIGIADDILNKPLGLTEQEYANMKSHTAMGHNILRNSKRKILQTAATIAYEHHEKYDGSGYPRGLKGEEISIFARIVAIVDVLDALLSKRVYKDVWSVEDALELLKKERGKHFDPKLVDIVVENIDRYVEVFRELSEAS